MQREHDPGATPGMTHAVFCARLPPFSLYPATPCFPTQRFGGSLPQCFLPLPRVTLPARTEVIGRQATCARRLGYESRHEPRDARFPALDRAIELERCFEDPADIRRNREAKPDATPVLQLELLAHIAGRQGWLRREARRPDGCPQLFE